MGARLETPIQRTYLALGIVFAVLTVLVTCVRFYSRKLSRATFGIDDWLALAAALFYLTEIAVHLWSMLAGGVGMHQNKSTSAQLELAFKVSTDLTLSRWALLTGLVPYHCRISIHSRSNLHSHIDRLTSQAHIHSKVVQVLR